MRRHLYTPVLLFGVASVAATYHQVFERVPHLARGSGDALFAAANSSRACRSCVKLLIAVATSSDGSGLASPYRCLSSALNIDDRVRRGIDHKYRARHPMGGKLVQKVGLARARVTGVSIRLVAQSQGLGWM